MESQEMGGDDIPQGKRRKKKNKRLDDGGRKAITGEPTRLKFPLLELPEELQLLVAAHVFSPRDRAALCVAVPPLGRKAIKQIPAYTGPLMSLGKRVLSGGAVDEAEVRRYVREFAPSEAEHPSLALNECAQLNAMAAPSARVRCVVQGSNLEWRLESGALLRCWKPFASVRNYMFTYTRGTPGMHHYEGAAGAERLVAYEESLESILARRPPAPLPHGQEPLVGGYDSEVAPTRLALALALALAHFP